MCLIGNLLWEQEIVGSNLTAPTSLLDLLLCIGYHDNVLSFHGSLKGCTHTEE